MLYYPYKGGVKMIERKKYLNDLKSLKDKNTIKVITGIRRCGKSTILNMYADYLNSLDSNYNVIRMNFESAKYRHITNAEQLYDYVSDKIVEGSMNYVILDEVQQVSEFEKAVDWLYVEDNTDIYITGSNAFLLSSELATLLSGRYVEIKMLPLSLSEYEIAHPNENIPKMYNEYLQKSSFPGTLELERKNDINLYLDGIYNTVIIKDIVQRNNVSNIASLKNIVEYIFDNIGNISSSTKIANTLSSVGKKVSVPTVESYLDAMVNSYLIYKVSRYDVKGRAHLTTGYKYYVADIGLRYYLLGNKISDTGHILENIVYLELIRRGYQVYIGKVENNEVDFIAYYENTTSYFQVSLTVMEESTLMRELKSLQSIPDHNAKYLLTTDYMGEANYNGIQHINVFDWLLE